MRSPSKAVTTVAPVALSSDDIKARIASLIASDPNVAIAVALQSLSRSRGSRNSAPVSTTETETQRANRCLAFTDSTRGKIVAFAIETLGDKDSVAIPESALIAKLGLPDYKVRPALAIVEARANDTGNDKFPAVSQFGYSVAVAGERNEPRTLHFARLAPVAKPARKARKARAVAVVAPASDDSAQS